MYSQTAVQVVRAPRSAVYRALLDPRAIEAWRTPDGMTAHVDEHDAREGGQFRVTLTYAGEIAGKTEGRTDTYRGRFARLRLDEQVVEVITFESSDAALTGEMTVTTSLRDVGGGTEVELVHEGIPDAIRPDDNATGTRMSLAKLAAHVEEQLRAG